MPSRLSDRLVELNFFLLTDVIEMFVSVNSLIGNQKFVIELLLWLIQIVW